MRVDELASSTEVRLPVDDPLEIVLAEAPTTGHGWRVIAAGDPVVQLESDAFAPPAGTISGAAGAHTWRFRAVRRGTAALELHYVHLFQAGPPARRFLLRVTVS